MLIVSAVQKLVRSQKKKRGLITSSTLSEVSPNTIQPYPSKSPRHRREHPCFYSWLLLNFGEISESKIQADASIPICLFVFAMS